MTFSVHHASFAYRQTPVLKDICFFVEPGQILAVLGPSGVGKTTLLKCMMGLIKWDSGSSQIDGIPIPQIHYREFWKKIAYVPQAKNTVFSYSVEEMVVMGRSAHIGSFKQPSASDHELARQAMDEVGISHLKHRPCSEISGGELQMVLIARALSAQPSILVLDEPESNLDFKNQLVILDTIESLACEKNISCVFNTHYPAHALKIATHALVLTRDKYSLFGPAREVINEDNMRRAFEVNVHINEVKINQKRYTSVLALSVED
ncbi:MAG: ABC transporter ATP-binding protein [Spirochaetaceae bacterium]|nr:ABC transporter ATP-binding protein [Spirochaetaceae bacterium]